ncbi:Rossmann fold nucleotide-binding protein Smf possibly involved in DNA uptake [hydrothermal vent metagenome]|uniref:Rossmann fold nucleotide-binding protein Smf possibly involved in DNA uptake n=1 Tax=hydrothermal vent metagenome TaxID=652676 RepID=A0A3B1A3J0_9ZZZZ
MDEIGYWLELLHTPTIGPRRYQTILEHIEHPQALFEGSHDDVLAKLPSRAQAYLRRPNWQRTEKALLWAEQPNHHIITLDNPAYPHLLKQIADPPPLLFAMGNVGVLGDPQMAIVGSRNPSPQGKQNAYDFACALSQAGLVITSGLAIGVDTSAHCGALSVRGQTVAVTGTGLDMTYPRSNQRLAQQIVESGLLISEFPLGTDPSPGNFPRRNRIISGLSLGVLVVEAGLASGSLISARLATEQGREVFAIPGSIHNPLSKGCHRLLRDGATLVESLSDILQEVSVQLSPFISPQAELPGSDSKVVLGEALELLLKNIGNDPVSVDELIVRCGLTAEQISSMLIQLELNDLVASSAGRYYKLPEKVTK